MVTALHGAISVYYERYRQGHRRDRLWLARVYKERVKGKSFCVGDLVWKMILPIGFKRNKFRKWSPNWDGPYGIEEVILENSYMVQNLQGTSLPRALYGKYLKR
jgi:hypothetical protein